MMWEAERKLLLRAADIIEQPEAWTRESYARDARGVDVEAWDERATCWCALGALRVARGGRVGSYCGSVELLREYLKETTGCPDVSNFNDYVSIDAHEVATAMRNAARKEYA